MERYVAYIYMYVNKGWLETIGMVFIYKKCYWEAGIH